MPGTDGRKMSKSYGNALNIADDMETVWGKLRTMTTDPARERRTDPGTPEKCPVWDIQKFFNKDPQELLEIHEGCTKAGIGCVDCKKKLMVHLEKMMAPIRERRATFENREDDLRQILELTEHNTENKHEETTEDRRGFEVRLEAFSGPLDLLCHLVESREVDPSKLNLTELVSQYVSFLINSGRTSLNDMADFFSFASRLLLRKVHSLFPSQLSEEEESPDEIYEDTEEELLRLLEAFHPYRNAASHLA
ncbi:MAG: segregation/condensation protein A, partial [Synergistaceae bacterium]